MAGKLFQGSIKYPAIALMLLALLLPIYGPWIDPGYVGRLPQHDHIYIGKIDPNHHHDHRDCLRDAAGSRSHAEEQSPKERFAAFLATVISLPDQDAAQQSLVHLIHLDEVPSLQRFDTLWIPIEETNGIAHGIIINPPEEPPRS
jgi:hypothetical protein